MVEQLLNLALEQDAETALSFLFLTGPGKEHLFDSENIQQTFQDFWGFPPNLNKCRVPLMRQFLLRASHTWHEQIEEVARRSLLRAIRLRDAESTSAILSSGMNLDFLGPQNLSPLMLAAKSGNSDLINQLIDAGASPGFRNSAGKDALGIAWFYNRVGAIGSLEKAFARQVEDLRECQA